MTHRVFYLQGMDRFSDFGRAGCSAPTGFWPGTDEVNAWCACEYAGDANNIAKCQAPNVGWPWTVEGKAVRNLPVGVSDVLGATTDVSKVIGGGSSTKPVSPGVSTASGAAHPTSLTVGGQTFQWPAMAQGKSMGMLLIGVAILGAGAFLFAKQRGAFKLAGYSSRRKHRRIRGHR